MSKSHARTGHGNSRKIGRSLAKCQLYRSRHTREKNKIKRLKKLLIRFPNNKQMVETVKKLEALI